MNHPRVTVLMPVFNAECFLDQSIQSILNQSYQDFKFLIINDGSTDNSLKVIEKYILDKRIELISLQKNQGLISCLNIGLEKIYSQFIVRMDADDISHPERIRLLVEIMDSNPNVGICGTRVGEFALNIPKNIPIICDASIRAIHFFNCSITHASAIYRKDVISHFSIKYRLEYIHSEDNDFITEILSVSEGRIIDLPLYFVRKHPNQVSAKFNNIQKQSSSIKRFEFLKNEIGLNLTNEELMIYKALSYKEVGLFISEFEHIKDFTSKFKYSVLNHYEYKINKNLFIQILYNRISLLYLRNSYIGVKLLINYLRYFALDFNIFIFFRLSRRVFYGI